MNLIPTNILFLIYLSSFSGFLNFYTFGITSNPLFFILSLIFGSGRLNVNLLRRYIFLPLIILIGTIFTYLVGNDNFDFKFIFTLVCVYLEFFLVQNIAVYTTNLNRQKFLLNMVANLLILIFIITLILNILNLHCLLYKCIEFGKTGMSFMSSEPSYVGLISIFYLSFYFLAKELLNKNKGNLILACSLIMVIFSRSLNSIIWFIFIVIWLTWPYLFNLIKLLILKFSLRKYIRYFIFSLPFFIFSFLYLSNSDNFKNEITALSSILYFDSLFNIDTLNTINLASGDRLNYFMASLSSGFNFSFLGHGLLSSSLIFEDNLLKVYELFDNNYEVTRGLKELGSKPHTLFGLIFFSNGFIGLIYLFKEQLLILKKHTMEIIINSNYINDKYFTKKNFFTILPFILLLYPSTNTDTFKFITFYIYFNFFYSSLRNN